MLLLYTVQYKLTQLSFFQLPFGPLRDLPPTGTEFAVRETVCGMGTEGSTGKYIFATY